MNVFHRSKSQPIIKSQHSVANRDSNKNRLLKATPVAKHQKKNKISRSKSNILAYISKSYQQNDKLTNASQTNLDTSKQEKEDLYEMILNLDKRVQSLENRMKKSLKYETEEQIDLNREF